MIQKVFTCIMNAIVNILPRIWWIYNQGPYNLASNKGIKALFLKPCTNLEIVEITIEPNYPRIKKV